MSAATLTVRGITYRQEGDQLGATCECGESFVAAEIRPGSAKAAEMKAWIGKHRHEEAVAA